jgi:perosamine synthetase
MKVVQFEPFIDHIEYEAIKDCFDKKWITEGPKTLEFKNALCEMIGAKYGVFAPNGTLALYLGLRALGIGPGDEVIVPDFTFIASANAVEMTGATPVFVDINLDDLQINIEGCHNALTPRTKAIMPVHLYGMVTNMPQLLSFAKNNNLLVIEDAAQALGINWEGKACGNFGDIGCFSFFADKTLTTGEGGFVVTNNKEIYENLCYLRNQGRMNRGTFEHPHIGYNFRMTDIQSAIGLAQLSKFDTIVSLKNTIFHSYNEQLNNLDIVEEITVVRPRKEINPFIPFRVIALTKEPSAPLMNYMKQKEIETRTFFYPLHKQPCFKNKFSGENLINSVYAYNHGICLPSYPRLGETEITYVCDTIKDYYKGKRI